MAPRGELTLNFGFVAVSQGGVPRAASDVAELRWFAVDELPRTLAFPHQQQMIDDWIKASR
jgi:hypothetical protein